MPTACLLFHGSLNDFLSTRQKGIWIGREFEAAPGLFDVVQAIGVPHPEVDLVLANGRPVGLDYRLEDGARVEVFGHDTGPDPASAGVEVEVAGRDDGLIPSPPEPRRFVLDGHLGRLARYLRTLGFDSAYEPHAADPELARVSASEGRILLTRDRGLLKRSIVRLGYLVRPDDPRRQLDQVVARYDLAARARPFSRCVRCNGDIEPVARAEVEERLAGEPRTLRYFDSFGRCGGCGAIYWSGSHYERMSRLVGEVVGREPPIGENRGTYRREDRG